MPVLGLNDRRRGAAGQVLAPNIIGHTMRGVPVVRAFIRRIGRRGERFLGVKPCPFCGGEHGHGVGSGERGAHCFRGSYVLLSHDDGGRGVPPFIPLGALGPGYLRLVRHDAPER
jgi:hypothetical protein